MGRGGASPCSVTPSPFPRPPAQALECHVCAYEGENCFNPMPCPAMVAYCMTTRTCELWSAPHGPWACGGGCRGAPTCPGEPLAHLPTPPQTTLRPR